MAHPLSFEFAGVVMTAILYGVYCLLYELYWQIQLKRADRWKDVFFYALTVNFILCVMYFIMSTIRVQFLISVYVLNEIALVSSVLWVTSAMDVLYTAIDFISQLILLYRCWIMWRQPLVMVIPCILSLTFLVTALTTLGFQIKATVNNLPLPDWYHSSVTAFFFMSLGVNTLVTSLIVYRIMTIYNDIQGLDASVQARTHGKKLVSILIESGLITFVGQLTQSIMYKSEQAAFPLVRGCVVMLYGVSSTAVFVRVEMHDNNTSSKTANSMKLEYPIQEATKVASI